MTSKYGLLSLAFCFGSIPAIWFLHSGDASVLPWAAVLCWLIIAAHALTVVLCAWHSRTEEPRTVIRRFPNPNYDEREL